MMNKMKIKSCYMNYASHKHTFFNGTDFDVINPISVIANLVARNMICCVDSYNKLNKYSNLNIIHYRFLPKFNDVIDFDKSFEDITDKRINELIEKANNDNKNVCIFWSGGIDSQVILSGLLLNNFPFNRIVLLTNNHSINNENNMFYRKYIKDKICCVIGMQTVYDYLQNNNNYICVDGDYGGNLVTSVFNYKYNEYFYKDWKDVLKYIYIDKTNDDIFRYRNNLVLSSENLEFIVNEWNKLFEYIGIEVKTMGAFMHLAEYNLCSVSDSLEFMLMFNIKYKNYYEFYSCIDYHKWALLNYIKNYDKENIVMNPKICKLDYKNYIFKYDKDIDYLNNKSKELSMDNLFDNSNVEYKFINGNFLRVLYENDDIETYNIKSFNDKKMDKLLFINSVKRIICKDNE